VKTQRAISDMSPALVMRTEFPDEPLKGEPEITRSRHPGTTGTVVDQPRPPAQTNGKRRGQDRPRTAHQQEAPRSVWAALQMDWDRRASRPDAAAHLAIWKQTAPQLGRYASPTELLEVVGSFGYPEQSCRLLSALLVAARRDALAAHAVLVALIPGLRAAASRRWQTAHSDGPWTSRDELDTDTISTAWQTIATHAGQHHPRPARLIIQSVERQLRTTHDAHRRQTQRWRLQGDLDNTTAERPENQDVPDPLTLALLDRAPSGPLDPASLDIAHRVALLDEAPSTAGRRHGLDHRQTLATLRATLHLLDGDHRRTSYPERHPRQIAPSNAQEVHPMASLPQPIGPPRDAQTRSPVMPLLLTVNQAAELLGMGRSTLYELLDAGELRSIKRGASRRIPLKEVHQYIDRLLDRQNCEQKQGSAVPSAS
jgi:excisionase family DNA binding protein